MKDENAKIPPSLVLKIDLTPAEKKAKRIYLRMDAIQSAEVKDGFAVITLVDDFGSNPATAS